MTEVYFKLPDLARDSDTYPAFLLNVRDLAIKPFLNRSKIQRQSLREQIEITNQASRMLQSLLVDSGYDNYHDYYDRHGPFKKIEVVTQG